MTARVMNQKEQTGAMVQLVSFHVAREEYVVGIHHLQEILRTRKMTRVPKAPTYIKGVINLRGKIVPVMDLRARLGLKPGEQGGNARIMVVNYHAKIVGLVVDSMSEVLTIPESLILPRPVTAKVETASTYIRGVAKLEQRLLILLDLEALLDDGGY